MHQNDRLMAQDAPAFERALDQALASADIGAALSRTNGALNTEQLRTAALGARDTLTAAAASEYRELVRLRTAASGSDTRPTVPPPSSGTTSRSGGVLPALGVLIPSLAATAAAVFLLIGFGMRAVATSSRLAEELITAGWTAAGVAAVATLTGLVWLLVTASRNRAVAEADTLGESDPAASQAHAAWQLALLERGIMPFLLGRIEAATSGRRPSGRTALPRPAAAGVAGGAGESRPAPADGPGFSSPDFASPDFASPDFGSPDFAGPDYGRPGFSGPAAPGSP
ncbi:hypothetical protein ACFU7T_04865 [Streptomyces sp. NPDC057555]|uniref:hypothetical protein n=1 Tax=Streptomyces sp. NPDC057555 TaxID=3346166 RepID=UPI003699C31E